MNHIYTAVADLEGVSALQKLEVKTKEKSHHQFFELAAASLPFSTAPKPTGDFALRNTN